MSIQRRPLRGKNNQTAEPSAQSTPQKPSNRPHNQRPNTQNADKNKPGERSSRHSGSTNQRHNNHGHGAQRNKPAPRNQVHRQPPRKIEAPPFFQRDVLFIPSGENTQGLEEIRAKFDPLSKKIPVHLTLVYSEPAEKIPTDFFNSKNIQDLPPLGPIVFNRVEIFEEKYLWLLPDDDGTQKITTWRQRFQEGLENKSQEEDFPLHITLGYVPRSMAPDDVMKFVFENLKLPLLLQFNRILLEEFSENQSSNVIGEKTLSQSN